MGPNRAKLVYLIIAVLLMLACSLSVDMGTQTPVPIASVSIPKPTATSIPSLVPSPTPFPTFTPTPTVIVPTPTNTLPPGPYLYCKDGKTLRFADRDNEALSDLTSITKDARKNFKKGGNVDPTGLADAADEIQAIKDEVVNLKPPEYLADYHRLELRYLNLLIKAYTAGDEGKKAIAQNYIKDSDNVLWQMNSIAETVNFYCGRNYMHTH